MRRILGGSLALGCIGAKMENTNTPNAARPRRAARLPQLRLQFDRPDSEADA